MQQLEQIPVFFSVDDNYAPYLSVALRSLIENANPRYVYRIIILHQNLSSENQKKLMALKEDYAEIEFVPIEGKLKMITDQMSNRLRCDYFTLTIYFRLLIPAMFPQFDKGIYVDSDIVVPGDISELYHMELGDHLIGACTDATALEVPELVHYLNVAVGIPEMSYINSGVLLMNLKKLREVEMEKRFLELFDRYHFDTVAPDQDYLNAMCYGKILYLPECWDVMPDKNKPELKQPKLIHYNLFSKPWYYDDIPYESYFWKYARTSQFYDEIRQKKKNYSEQDRQSDQKCMELLIQRTVEIAGQEENFKTVFESGRECRL